MTELWASLVSALHDALSHVSVTDVLDVLLVAVVLYLALMWLRRSAARSLVLAAAALVGLYLLAGALELYLALRLLQAVLAVSAVGLVVVFQNDIRRLLDRLGTWRLGGRRPSVAQSRKAVDAVIEAAGTMAGSRTGALIAIHGRDPSDRHLSGGTDLDGQVSARLLCSIFNPSAPTHDGAVVIVGGRIASYGVKLPLSSDHRQLAGRGTRHAAALGLSEHCDAMVVIVSEERGTVCLAEGGRLTELHEAEDARNRLNEFWERHYGSVAKRTLPQWWRLDLRSAALALLLAGLFWITFAHKTETLYRTYAVPVVVRDLPQSVQLGTLEPAEVKVTFAGPERAFRLIKPGELAVSFPLADATPGMVDLDVSPDDVQAPRDVRVTAIEPQKVSVQIEPAEQQ